MRRRVNICLYVYKKYLLCFAAGEQYAEYLYYIDFLIYKPVESNAKMSIL